VREQPDPSGSALKQDELEGFFLFGVIEEPVVFTPGVPKEETNQEHLVL